MFHEYPYLCNSWVLSSYLWITSENLKQIGGLRLFPLMDITVSVSATTETMQNEAKTCEKGYNWSSYIFLWLGKCHRSCISRIVATRKWHSRFRICPLRLKLSTMFTNRILWYCGRERKRGRRHTTVSPCPMVSSWSQWHISKMATSSPEALSDGTAEEGLCDPLVDPVTSSAPAPVKKQKKRDTFVGTIKAHSTVVGDGNKKYTVYTILVETPWYCKMWFKTLFLVICYRSRGMLCL